MQAINRAYSKIINGASQFVIPVFQRDYSWSEENCQQLWKDILSIANDAGKRHHFMGSVVYIATNDSSAGFTRWLLIDGQQRVTTLTLLMIALRDYIKATGWKGSEDGPTAKKINAYFLKNTEEEGDRETKLRLRRNDDATLQALIDGTNLPQPASSGIQENYELFYELLSDVDPDVVYAGFNRLVVVDVALERGIDNPQLVFESLNSTGVDLSPSDLIRNFILMGLDEKEQTRLYDQYWGKIEALFKGSERVFDNFVRDFLGLRNRSAKLERTDRVYSAFRSHFSKMIDGPDQLESLLSDLLKQASYYAAFAVRSPDSELGKAFTSLRRNADVPAITVMRLHQTHSESKTLSEAEFVEAIYLIESYLLRRTFTGAQSRGYGTEFAKLAYKIDEKKPLASLKAAMAKFPSNYAFPSDAAFKAAMLENDVYGKRICFHFLDALENRDSKEQTDTSKYSIEHVLPQNDNLGPKWRSMLGDDWQDIQQEWLHRLGNLTLTGYNSRYSDKPFDKKQSIEGGFADSSVRLNKDIRDAKSWGPDEISKRGQRLAKRALKLWPPLEADPKVIHEMEAADKRALAKRRNVDAVPMTEDAIKLFAILRKKLGEQFPSSIELAEKKAVSYHDLGFFLEVIPRKYHLSLLIALDYNEAADDDGDIQDTADYSFITNSNYDAGILILVNDEEDIDWAMEYVAQAHALLPKPASS